VTVSGTLAGGRAFIRVAARDIGSGLPSVGVVQATNVSVMLPSFPPDFRDPAVVTTTKLLVNQRSSLTLSVTNRAGVTVTCDPVISQLVGQQHGPCVQVFTNLSQRERYVQYTNGTPGLNGVQVRVNGHQLRLDQLRDGDVRTLDPAGAMHAGDHNDVVVLATGPSDGSGVLVVSD
jgi:hypothetical protein